MRSAGIADLDERLRLLYDWRRARVRHALRLCSGAFASRTAVDGPSLGGILQWLLCLGTELAAGVQARQLEERAGDSGGRGAAATALHELDLSECGLGSEGAQLLAPLHQNYALSPDRWPARPQEPASGVARIWHTEGGKLA